MLPWPVNTTSAMFGRRSPCPPPTTPPGSAPASPAATGICASGPFTEKNSPWCSSRVHLPRDRRTLSRLLVPHEGVRPPKSPTAPGSPARTRGPSGTAGRAPGGSGPAVVEGRALQRRGHNVPARPAPSLMWSMEANCRRHREGLAVGGRQGGGQADVGWCAHGQRRRAASAARTGSGRLGCDFSLMYSPSPKNTKSSFAASAFRVSAR